MIIFEKSLAIRDFFVYLRNSTTNKMKTIEKIFKITPYGELAQYNARLRIWELVSIAWSWDDIHPDYLEESKNNWEDSKL